MFASQAGWLVLQKKTFFKKKSLQRCSRKGRQFLTHFIHMALLLERHTANGIHLGVWNVEEPEAFFADQLELQPAEWEELSPTKGRRRLEWLACRYLLHRMLSGTGLSVPRIAVHKDDCGKPYLANASRHLSFSHSHEWVAAILADRPAGIDIQKFVKKIASIAHKFMRQEEMDSLLPGTRLEHLHLYWCAKEAVYKAHGRRQLDFRRHIFIEPFSFEKNGGKAQGHIRKDDFSGDYDLTYEILGDYFLVYAESL
jgi:phosphopantetheinyl transferase